MGPGIILENLALLRNHLLISVQHYMFHISCEFSLKNVSWVRKRNLQFLSPKKCNITILTHQIIGHCNLLICSDDIVTFRGRRSTLRGF